MAVLGLDSQYDVGWQPIGAALSWTVVGRPGIVSVSRGQVGVSD